MFASSWLGQLQRRCFGRRARNIRAKATAVRQRRRPSLEVLEDRTLLSGNLPYATPTNSSQLAADITQANANGGQNTITLGATIQLTSVDNNTDGANGLPVIVAGDQLTIVGNGYTIARSTATGTAAFRLFDVASGASLTLQDLTLTDGLAQGTGVAAEGGAVYSSGELSLSGVTVQSNKAQGSNGTNATQAGAAGGNGANASGGGLYVAGGSVTLSNDTLSGNNAQGGNGGQGGNAAFGGGSGGSGGDATGGGLYVASGTVTLTNDTLSNNDAQGGNGAQGGTAAVIRGGNGGSGGNATGGGLYVAAGSVTLTNDTLSGNNAQGGNGGHRGTDFEVVGGGGSGGSGGNATGGGLYTAAGSVTLTNDTLSDNDAQGGNGGQGGTTAGLAGASGGNGGNATGGGVYVASGSVTLTNDTLTGNNAQGGLGGLGGSTGSRGGSGGFGGSASGGGLYVAGGSVTLSNDTLSGNDAQGGKGGQGGSGGTSGGGRAAGGSGGNATGGGLYLVSGSTTTLANTLIAQDTLTAGTGARGGSAGSASGPDVSGTVTSSDHDLVGDGTGSSGFSTANGDQVGTSARPIDPLLAPLGNYGGPTQTIALLPGSPALDAGTSSDAPPTDQRGVSRPQGGAPDVGAFQSQGFNFTVSGGDNQSTPITTAFAQTLVVTVTAVDGVDPVAGGQLTFTTPSSGASAALSPANPVTIASDGTARVKATANATAGTYDVTANTAGVLSPAAFLLTNVGTTTTTASNATTTFNASTQNLTLNASVTSDAGAVNAGSVTFTVLQGGTVLGTATTSGTLSNGQASVRYALPAGTAAGTYTLEAVYNAGADFLTSSDTTHSLTITPAAASIQLTSVTIVPNLLALNQTETINVHVSGSGGVVNAGTVLFSVDGHSVSAAVDGNGDATASLTLPLLTAAFPQSINAAFSGPNRSPTNATQSVFWNGLEMLSSAVATFVAAGGQSVQSYLLGLPLLDFLYSPSGRLTEVVFGPDWLSWDFSNFGALTVVTLDGVLPVAVLTQPQ
jgi:hypothetical protein